MDLYMIGPERKGPQAIGLAKATDAELAQLQTGHPDATLTVHRKYQLGPGWGELAMAVVMAQLQPYSLQGNWYNVDPATAGTAVDKAYRATQLDGPRPPAPNYAGIMKRLRMEVFGTTQEVMARIAGASGSRVSRWETGDLEPGLLEIHRLRTYAAQHGLRWDDQWMHELPESES